MLTIVRAVENWQQKFSEGKYLLAGGKWAETPFFGMSGIGRRM